MTVGHKTCNTNIWEKAYQVLSEYHNDCQSLVEVWVMCEHDYSGAFTLAWHFFFFQTNTKHCQMTL